MRLTKFCNNVSLCELLFSLVVIPPRKRTEAGTAHSVQWLGFWLHERRILVQFPAGARDFLFPEECSLARGSTQPLNQWVSGLFPLKWSDHSYPFSAKVNSKWRYATTIPTWLHRAQKENFASTTTVNTTNNIWREWEFEHLVTRYVNTISKVRWVIMVHDYMLDELNGAHRKTGDFSFLLSYPE